MAALVVFLLSQDRNQLTKGFTKRSISKASIEQALQHWQAAVRRFDRILRTVSRRSRTCPRYGQMHRHYHQIADIDLSECKKQMWFVST